MSVDHIVLGIIGLAPSTGYDMRAEIEKGSIGLLSALSFGSIYPRVRALQDEGFVRMEQEDKDGRKRKLYELTAKGWQELQRWLMDEEAAYPLPMRDELLVKILFWGIAGAERHALREHLQARREESEELLAYLRSLQSDSVTFIDEYGMLVFSYMESKIEGELAWIEKASTQLLQEPELPHQDPKWLAVLQKARRKKALGEGEE
jgi:PadR family transcriptional regulator, regulatory protein AphA